MNVEGSTPHPRTPKNSNLMVQVPTAVGTMKTRPFATAAEVDLEFSILHVAGVTTFTRSVPEGNEL